MPAAAATRSIPIPAGSTLLRGRDACTEGDMLLLYARCLRVVQGADPAMIPGLCQEEAPGLAATLGASRAA